VIILTGKESHCWLYFGKWSGKHNLQRFRLLQPKQSSILCFNMGKMASPPPSATSLVFEHETAMAYCQSYRRWFKPPPTIIYPNRHITKMLRHLLNQCYFGKRRCSIVL